MQKKKKPALHWQQHVIKLQRKMMEESARRTYHQITLALENVFKREDMDGRSGESVCERFDGIKIYIYVIWKRSILCTTVFNKKTTQDGYTKSSTINSTFRCSSLQLVLSKHFNCHSSVAGKLQTSRLHSVWFTHCPKNSLCNWTLGVFCWIRIGENYGFAFCWQSILAS